MKFKDISKIPQIKNKKNKIYMSSKIINPKKINNIKQKKNYLKPKGLWYGCGNSQINHIIKENLVKQYINGQGIKYMYKIDFDTSSLTNIDKPHSKKILHISNATDFDKFTKKYGYKPEDYNVTSINWGKVGKDYAGIEISPYLKNRKYIKNSFLRNKSWWYQSWDTSYGCIWKPKIINNCDLLITHNKTWKKYK